MEIVIKIHDIPTNDHERWVLKYGIPLPKTHGDLVDRNELLKQYGLENATKYGNKDAEQQKHSYSTMMMYEIADMIEDAETIIPATKEDTIGKFVDALFFGESAMKEGDGE